MVFGNSMFQASMHTGDATSYWSVLDAQHDRYRRSLRVLVGAAFVLLALSAIIHPALAGAAVALMPIVGVHVVLMRHSRSRVKIPDHRPKDACEAEPSPAVDRGRQGTSRPRR